MKNIKSFEGYSISKKDISRKDQFVDYFLGFYGSDGIYGNFFDNKLTSETVNKYIDEFIKNIKGDFDGDSFDRELFRDVLLVKLGICNARQVEYNIDSLLTELEVDTAKYNL